MEARGRTARGGGGEGGDEGGGEGGSCCGSSGCGGSSGCSGHGCGGGKGGGGGESVSGCATALLVEDCEVVAPPKSLAIRDSTALGLEPRCNRRCFTITLVSL